MPDLMASALKDLLCKALLQTQIIFFFAQVLNFGARKTPCPIRCFHKIHGFRDNN